MKNDNVKFIVAVIVAVFLSSIFNALASGTLFDSSEVIYDNSSTNLNQTTVQGAIDDLYAAATDYSDLSTRLSNVEKYFTHFPSNQGVTFTEPTSRFDNAGIDINYNGPQGSHGWISFYANGNQSAQTANIDSTTTQTRISAYNGAGGYATLKLVGSSIVNKDNNEIKPVICITNNLYNVTITTKSASGAYYSPGAAITDLPSGATVISIIVTWWANAPAAFSANLASNTQVSFMSNISQTVGQITYRVCYI